MLPKSTRRKPWQRAVLKHKRSFLGARILDIGGARLYWVPVLVRCEIQLRRDKLSLALDALVADFEVGGSRRVDRCLGIQKMPDGYALMLDADEMYFYWLREDGQQSEIHWNKWAVRKGAVLHGKKT